MASRPRDGFGRAAGAAALRPPNNQFKIPIPFHITCLAHGLAMPCRGQPAAPAEASASAEAPAAAEAPDRAVPPFSAEQIRAATRPGRSYEFRMEAAGKPAQRHRITFVEVTPESATAEAV